MSYAGKSKKERQQYCDRFLAILESKVPEDERLDKMVVEYGTMGGDSYLVPKWFTTIQGHKLVSYVRDAAPFINKYNDDKKLFKRITSFCYANYPEIIPMDIVDTLKSIQEA